MLHPETAACPLPPVSMGPPRLRRVSAARSRPRSIRRIHRSSPLFRQTCRRRLTVRPSIRGRQSPPSITVFRVTETWAGMWEHVERTRARDWYFNADFLWMSTKPPQGIFGNPSAQTYVRQERDFLNGSSSSGGSGSGSGSGSGGSGSGSGSSTANATDTLLQHEGYITDSGSYFASLANYYNALDLGTSRQSD